MTSDVYYDGFFVSAGGECRESKLLSDEQNCLAVVVDGEYRYRIAFDRMSGKYLIMIDSTILDAANRAEEGVAL